MQARNGHGVNGQGPEITNLASNPSAYSDTNDHNGFRWSSVSPTPVTSVSAPWASRGRAARVTWPDGSGSGALATIFLSGLSPNTQYTASWKFKVSKDQKLIARASNFGSGGTQNDASNLGGQLYTSGVHEVWSTFTTGSDSSATVRIGVLTYGQSYDWYQADYLEMSDVMVVEGSTVHNYADGETDGWSWNDTPDQSTSTGPAP